VDALNLAKQAGQAVVNSAVSAGVSTVIYGGNSENFLSSFKQGLMTSAVNKIGEKMANKIGSAYKDGDINNVVRYVAHAGAGCVMGLGLAGASNSSNDESLSCFSGAGGAVVGELAADAYKAQKIEDLAKQYEGYASQLRAQGATNATIEAAFQSPEMQDLMNQQMADLKAVGVDLAKLSGAFAALAAGGDVSIAAQTGENAAKNNALFLIPLAIIALKAIDVALTAKELWDIYDTNKNNPEGLSKALAEWLAIEAGGAAVGKVIPGFKTAQEMIDWLRKNDVLSVSMVDGIEKSFKGFKGEQPDSAPNVLNDAPTPDNPLDLTAVGGKASFVKQMTVPNNAIRNDGILGEQVAEQIIGDATGLTFRTTLKNNSNNGVDLIAIDEKTNTIWIIEVKSSINGQFPSVQSQNLVTRSKDWILNASNGSINNQQLDPAEVEYAQKIQDMVKNGWNLKPMYSTVSIPKPNTTGPATVTIQPVI
jgi:Holliday junction resolvase-like predicted endonuclease